MKKLTLFCVLIGYAALAFSQTSSPKPWLGMGLVLRPQADGGKFLYVAHAPKDMPAYQSGIRQGDLITAIDGKPITFRDDLDLIEYTSALAVGRILKLRVVRAGKQHDLRLRVGRLPAEYEERFEESLRRAREARARR